MAKPRIFISSTYYDLKHLRSSLENFIDTLGYEPILSEKGDIAYTPDVPLDESCYREIHNSDMYVLIIGGRYGSPASSIKKEWTKEFYERYDSITKMEYKNAADQDIPIHILIERTVYADYENYLKNKENKEYIYAHVDSVNIFHLIEEILSQPRNNPICQFDRYSDIENWLREQWAGLFRELLKRMSGQQQLASLTAQVAELSELNKTLKRYLETVVTRVAPKDSEGIIKAESERLEEAKRSAIIESNRLISHLSKRFKLPMAVLAQLFNNTHSYQTFLQSIMDHVKDDNRIEQLKALSRNNGAPHDDYNLLREALNLPIDLPQSDEEERAT
jgi:hypothetical protein